MRAPLVTSALVGTLVCAAVAAAGSRARAQDTWSEPFLGVRYLERTTAEPWRIFAARVDLCESGVRVRATTPSERGRVVSSYATETGVDLAVNGDFFDPSFQVRGLAVGDGFRWPGTADSTAWGLVAFGDGRALVSPEAELLEPAPEWITEAIGGVPSYVVQDGAPVTEYSRSFCDVRHPRTAVGLSRDRRTAILAVVDGRSAASAGMTCLELGTLMAELGSDVALNLDGGGSSTLWLRGSGVVNVPSDGSERTVANHLGVFATSLGAPYSCNHAVDAAFLHAALLDEDRSTDIDGDGLADACARDAEGITCYLARGDGFGVAVPGPRLADADGWSEEIRYTSIRMGDVDGDGAADVCAADAERLRCWRSNGSSFGEAIDGPALPAGTTPERMTTLRLVDVTGDGRADLCLRGPSRFECFPSLGDGFGPALAGPSLSEAEGWGDPSRHGTLRLGDVDGDGLADLCARHGGGVACWLADGRGFPRAIEGPAWSDDAGWSAPARWSTIRLVDVDADGRADLCGRTAERFECQLSSGRAFGPATVAGPPMTDDGGWGAPDRYETLRLADVDGDARLDLCARLPEGIRCWLQRDATFAQEITGPALSDVAGWSELARFRSIRFADVDGDRRADVCARDAAGLGCWLSDGSGFPTRVGGPAWTDDAGWLARARYATLRLAGTTCVARAETCNGVDDDCDGMRDEDGVCGGGPTEGDGGVASDGGGRADAAPPDAAGGSPGSGEGAGGCAAAPGRVPGGEAPSGLAVALALSAVAVRRRRRRASG